MADAPRITDQTGIGQAAASADKLTKEFRKLVYEFLSPVAQEAGESIASYFRLFRAENAIAVFQKAMEMRKKRNLSNSGTPPRLLAPLVEKASLEDDDYLRDLWAALLATSNSDDFRPYFITILSELSPLEANICQMIYQKGKIMSLVTSDFGMTSEFGEIHGSIDEFNASNIGKRGGYRLMGAPHFLGFAGRTLLTNDLYAAYSASLESDSLTEHCQVHEAIENLERLRMVTRLSASGEVYRVGLTVLGANLMGKVEEALGGFDELPLRSRR